MKNLITFIIPVRHPENCKDWARLKSKLDQTVKSISAQKGKNWQAVIVANEGADLPSNMPGNVRVKHVNFPPNPIFERGTNEIEKFYDAVRLDKGRRVLAGMLAAGETDYFMIVDDDDFISRKLTDFVSANKGANGWFIKSGLVWGDGGRLLYRYDDFDGYCGTSLIIRSDLYKLPDTFEAANDDYIKQMLGSHIYIKPHLAAGGTPLAPLPFLGAVYRIGHAEAHSKSPGLIGKFFVNRKTMKNPLKAAYRLGRLRYLNDDVKSEFWGTG